MSASDLTRRDALKAAAGVVLFTQFSGGAIEASQVPLTREQLTEWVNAIKEGCEVLNDSPFFGRERGAVMLFQAGHKKDDPTLATFSFYVAPPGEQFTNDKWRKMQKTVLEPASGAETKWAPFAALTRFSDFNLTFVRHGAPGGVEFYRTTFTVPPQKGQ